MDIKLSQAEIDYIKAKRETEKAEALATQKKKEEVLQKNILDKEKYIRDERALEHAQHAAAQAFIASFPKGWSIKYVPYTKTFKVDGDYLNPENPKECNWNREVLWEKTEEFTNAHIVKGTYDISVHPADNDYSHPHPAYMDLSSISFEFRKKYTRVKTVIKKIQAMEEVAAAKVAALALAASSTAKMEVKLKEMFPDAEIKLEKEWKNDHYYSGYRSRRGSSGYEIKVFTVNLPNGSYMKCRYSDDLSMSIERMHIHIPALEDEKDPLKKLEILNNLKF